MGIHDIEDYRIHYTPGDYHMEFTAFEIIGKYEDGKPLFHKANYQDGGDMVESASEAQPYFSGSIKWDGCANVQFDEQESCMLHFCGLKDALKIANMIKAVYDLAAIHIKHYHKDLAA